METHSPHKIYKEIIEVIRINKNKKVKILFDDIDMMKSVEEKIFEYVTVVKFIKPNCRYKNLYVELIIEKKQLQKYETKKLFNHNRIHIGNIEGILN